MPDWQLRQYRGTWVAYRSEDGQSFRRSLGTPDRKVAARKFAAFQAELARPIGISVADLWAAYCNEKRGARSQRRFPSEWKALAPTFSALDPANITVDHARRYAAQRRQQGKAEGTIWTELIDLRTVLNWAEDRKFIDRAPYIEVPMKPPPRERYLTRDEARRLVDACELPHLRLFVILALTAAGRPEALLELTWDRVHLDRGYVDLVVWDGKRRKGRARPPINAWLRAALREAREGALTPWVIEWAGRPVGSVKRGFARAAKRADLTGVTPHVLRHTAAVWMAEADVSMAEIANYLGHEDSRITERVYARFSPSGLQKAASALNLGSFEPKSIP